MLDVLACNDNPLTTLDVRNNTALHFLYVNNCSLTTLDVSNNTKLVYLYCEDNLLTTLDVSNNDILTRVSLERNELTASALNDLFRTLNGNPFIKNTYIPPGSMFIVLILGNPGTSDCDVSIAKEKGWTVYR